ncbi:cellulose binding domain-containing protein [Nocardioides conyzicola]|uniref:CBM2 domain-containing protein n=1 Tax=Nocardioides conyzicola TaxID=1651781 RepID=A0ABP8WUP5_9ACTN
MVELEIRTRRRRPWLRRLFSLLRWSGTLLVLVLAIPTPWGPPHLGVTVVSGQSMLPTYDPQELVVTWRADDYPVGTPIVYGIPAGQAGAGLNVVHRVVDTGPDGTHITQGDNNDHVDPWHPRNSDIRGKVVVHVPQGGRMLRILGSPLILAVLAGIMTAAAVLKRKDDEDPPDDSWRGPRRRKRHRRNTPRVMPIASRAVALAAVTGLVVTAVPARAADLGDIEAADLFASTTAASVAQNPVSYQQTLTSETATSYCATVVVTNHSAQAVQWEVSLNISQAPYNATTIASSYNATTVSFSATVWRVRGVDWNAALGAGQSYTWGYCANRPAGSLTDANASVSVTSSDPQSYCATVTVSTAAVNWVHWKVTIGHSTSGVTDPVYWLAAAPTNINNSATVSFDAGTGTWVVQGSGSNEYVKSGTDATFGYCAPTAAAAPYTDVTPTVTLSNQDSTSYCADVTVSTTSTTWIKWRATIDHTTPNLTAAVYWLNAAPTDLTNVSSVGFSATTGAWQAGGVAFNKLIKAGTPASWRFCAPKNTTGDIYTDATVSVSIASDWGAGYCTNVTVSTTSTDWITWRGTIDHTTPGVSASSYWLTSIPSSYYGVESISFTAGTGTWTFKGLSYNSQIKAGSPVTFGYCK